MNPEAVVSKLNAIIDASKLHAAADLVIFGEPLEDSELSSVALESDDIHLTYHQNEALINSFIHAEQPGNPKQTVKVTSDSFHRVWGPIMDSYNGLQSYDAETPATKTLNESLKLLFETLTETLQAYRDNENPAPKTIYFQGIAKLVVDPADIINPIVLEQHSPDYQASLWDNSANCIDSYEFLLAELEGAPLGLGPNSVDTNGLNIQHIRLLRSWINVALVELPPIVHDSISSARETLGMDIRG